MTIAVSQFRISRSGSPVFNQWQQLNTYWTSVLIMAGNHIRFNAHHMIHTCAEGTRCGTPQHILGCFRRTFNPSKTSLAGASPGF